MGMNNIVVTAEVEVEGVLGTMVMDWEYQYLLFSKRFL